MYTMSVSPSSLALGGLILLSIPVMLHLAGPDRWSGLSRYRPLWLFFLFFAASEWLSFSLGIWILALYAFFSLYGGLRLAVASQGRRPLGDYNMWLLVRFVLVGMQDVLSREWRLLVDSIYHRPRVLFAKVSNKLQTTRVGKHEPLPQRKWHVFHSSHALLHASLQHPKDD